MKVFQACKFCINNWLVVFFLVFSISGCKTGHVKSKEMKMSEPNVKVVMGQSSYIISTDSVEAALTVQGGHLGPVTFKLGQREIKPFSVAPWWNEEVSSDIPNIARILRGDLFALPFGLNLELYNGEQHQVHGETANNKWDRVEDFSKTSKGASLHVSMDLKVRPGKVDKWIILKHGQPIVYQRHTISGMNGPMCFGHHAMLNIPDYEGAAKYSCSHWTCGQVAVQPVELPENKGYSMLKTAAVFESLSQVPTVFADTPTDDLTTYPRGRGFEDVVSLAADPNIEIAWNCVTFPKEGFVWFALRDPKVLASTMLWLSNGGRHYSPWDGRHTNVLGIEDSTAFYYYGLLDSVGSNQHNQKGIKTFHNFSSQTPLNVNYIGGVAEIPEDFDKVEDIKFAEDKMTLISSSGRQVSVDVDLGFLKVQPDAKCN